MAKAKVRRAIIREWMTLAVEKRQSSRQALAFAEAAVQRHSLQRRWRRTPHDVILGWLGPHWATLIRDKTDRHVASSGGAVCDLGRIVPFISV